MLFIAKHTNIPVPRVYCAFTHKGRTYIVMERMRGQCLAQRWFDLAPEAKQKMFGQLKNMIDEMRNLLPRETGAISNVDGGALYDMRLPWDPSNANGRFGPFQSVQDFHRY